MYQNDSIPELLENCCWKGSIPSAPFYSPSPSSPSRLLPFLSTLLSPAFPSSGESAPQSCFRGCHRSYVVSQKSRRGAFGERTMVFSSCPWLFMASACWSPGRGAVGMFGDYFRKLAGRCALGQRENRQPMWAIQCAFLPCVPPKTLFPVAKSTLWAPISFVDFIHGPERCWTVWMAYIGEGRKGPTQKMWKGGQGILLYFNSFFGKEKQRSYDLLLRPGWLLGSQNSSIPILMISHCVYHHRAHSLSCFYSSTVVLLFFTQVAFKPHSILSFCIC